MCTNVYALHLHLLRTALCNSFPLSIRYETKRRNVLKNDLAQTQEQMVRPLCRG